MFERERWTEALGSFAQALALNPKSVEALVLRAEIHQTNQRMHEALAELDRALTFAPGNARARAVRARIRMLTGDREAAKRDLDASVRAKPSEGMRWAHRGLFYHAQVGALDRAQRDLAQGIQHADRLNRRLLRTCALAIAVHRGQRRRQTDLLAAMRDEEEPRRFERLLTLLLLGKLRPNEISGLQTEAARLPERRCLYRLAAGTRAAMDGQWDEARAQYQLARQKAAPNHLACVTAQWIVAARPRSTP